MDCIKNHDLYYENSMRLHSIATEFYEPTSTKDLIDVLSLLNELGKDYYILGGGSNILMPAIINRPVISIRSLNNTFKISNGLVYAGASLRMQVFIRSLQKNNLGGIEYLFSLPCLVGGAIYMNAGRSEKYSQSISDHIVSVEILDPSTLEVKTITKEQCQFSHRHSIFHSNKWIILGATFSFEQTMPEVIDLAIKERLSHSKKYLDASKPSCGSVFNKGNGKVLLLLRKLGIRKGGAKYSRKTTNWISNIGGASYSDVLFLIHIGILLHKITFSKYNVEIIIWE